MKISFDHNGIAKDYDGEIIADNYKDVKYNTTLKFLQQQRGCSSVRLIFEDIDGDRHGMFLKDFVEIAMTVGFTDKTVSGQFGFVKRGRDYGIRYLGELEEEQAK